MSRARPGGRAAHAAADVAWPPPGLAKPAQRALAGAQIDSLERLATFSESEIAALHGMGPNALATLLQALDARGLAFARPRTPRR